MDLLSTAKVREINKGIKVFVIKSGLNTDPDDADLFVLDPPPEMTDPAYHGTFRCMTSLCNNCKTALAYFSYCLKICRSQGKEAREDLPAACLVHVGVRSLEAGVEAGCHLCILMDTKIRGKRLAREGMDQACIEMCWQTESAESPHQVTPNIHFALTHTGHPRSARNYWNFLKLKCWSQSKLGPSMFGLTGTDSFVLSSSTGSKLSEGKAVEWLSRCQANEDGQHSQCNQGQSGSLPTRLLDVTHAVETSRLRLVTSSDQPQAFHSDGQYITLSHCWGAWGARELPILTSQNSEERQSQGLDVDLLPPTFKDALKIAQWFKVRWLWIDSLCIEQDNMKDWKSEAVQMYDVYRNALLNISADDSNDARWGCFRSRDPLSTCPLQLYFDLDDTASTVYRYTPDSTALFEGITDAPLAERAWVFQERQLSRRVLHFTSNELIWECCASGSQFASETFPHGAPFATLFNSQPKFQSESGLFSTDSGKIYGTWQKLCKAYSTKKLSLARDKLVALSGLAQEFQASLPTDSYTAGLWRSTLPNSLLWTSATQSERIQTDTYIAPSWSWLSIDGAITDFGPQDNPASLLKMLSIVTEPSNPSDPTGSLKAASIEVQCYLRAVKIEPDYEEKPWYMMAIGGGKNHKFTIEDDGRAEGFVVMNVGPQSSFSFSFDSLWSENSGPPSVSGYFMPISVETSSKWSPMGIQGLIVEPTDETLTTFRRIGTMTVYGLSNMRLIYKLKSGRDEGSWYKLQQVLKPSYEKIEAASERGVTSDEESETEVAEDVQVAQKLSALDVGSEDHVPMPTEPPENPDLDRLDALERWYALVSTSDVPLVGSESEYDFERLVPHRITLI